MDDIGNTHDNVLVSPARSMGDNWEFVSGYDQAGDWDTLARPK